MSQPNPKIAELEERLDQLVRTQVSFQTEVTAIRDELARLRGESVGPVTARFDATPQPSSPPPSRQPQAAYEPPKQSVPPPSFGHNYEAKPDDSRSRVEEKVTDYFSQYVENARANLEKFIGENLISKIGIIILVLGVGIGAKYAIDNNLISPLARIVFGYVFGVGLLGLAVKFKPKYHDFSAVLLSGGMAIMYFITYFAYASYGLMPQPAAFILMVMFTIFTVVAAVFYNRQIIAHIGLVGAYAVPFLLSNNSGNYAFLFAYMAILNAGILAMSIKKAWKPVFYTASAFTWIIFAAWFTTKFSADVHLPLALVTLGVFFAIFYVTKIVHGVVHPETDTTENVVSMIATAMVFYAFALAIGDSISSYGGLVALFSYLAAFALVILVTSYRFYGRVLAYVAYPFTWLIFGSWFFKDYAADRYFVLAATFATVFFLVFYVTTLVYRVLTEDIGMEESTGLVLTNSFIFYGFGYAILDSRENLRQFEGLFTAGHGVLHSLTAQIVSRTRPNAIDVVQTLAVLIITFTTIAIPIQFDGNHVTLIWSVEAAALFYFGRERSVRLFESLAYPVMLLATGSMGVNWLNVYADRFSGQPVLRNPFINGDFITGIVFVAAAAFIYFINNRKNDETVIDKGAIRIFGYAVAAVGLFSLWNVFRMEIGNYFNMLSATSLFPRVDEFSGLATVSKHPDFSRFNFVTQLNYTMLFLLTMSLVNLRKVRSLLAGGVNVAVSLLTLAATSTVGMYVLYELRVSYLKGDAAGLFGMSTMNVAARYLTFTLVVATLVSLYEYCRDDLLDPASTQAWRVLAFDATLYPCLLVISSCELMNLAAHAGVRDADKFGLSILWGVLALGVIVIGIARAKKHLRIGAFVLLGITLVKLFCYDATDLPTIPKTILFVSIGLLMLGISFLYNRFRNVIFSTVGNEEELEGEI